MTYVQDGDEAHVGRHHKGTKCKCTGGQHSPQRSAFPYPLRLSHAYRRTPGVWSARTTYQDTHIH